MVNYSNLYKDMLLNCFFKESLNFLLIKKIFFKDMSGDRCPRRFNEDETGLRNEPCARRSNVNPGSADGQRPEAGQVKIRT
jgi:hypothetical protein